MSSQPQLSVLIPIYNCEKYLEQCLTSVTGQTLQNIEIICINDGSTDQSRQIIQTFVDRDLRIVIIDKPNSGYGDSMNQGIKRATGEYIGIVEPDDWIDPDGFEKLYALAQASRADVVKANHYSFRHTKSGQLLESQSRYIQTQPAKPVYPKDYPQVFSYPPTIWAAIYRREFLLAHDITFLPTPGASYQDIGFNLKVWLGNPKTVLTPAAFLHYRLDNASSSVKQFDKVNCVVDEYRAIWEYVEQRHLEHDFAGVLTASQFRNYLWNLRRLPSRPARDFYQTLRTMLQTARQRGWLNHEDFSSRHWRLVQAILRHPRLAYLFVRAHTRFRPS